jgi:hypothetical protein
MYCMKRNCLVCCHVSLENSSVQFIRRNIAPANPNICLPGYAAIPDAEMYGHTTKKNNNERDIMHSYVDSFDSRNT